MLRGGAAIWTASLLLLFSSPVAWSAADEILVVGDSNRPYFRTYVDALASRVEGKGFTLKIVAVNFVDTDAMTGYRCIVTVGHEAAQRVNALPTVTPVLHALTTNNYADELRKNNKGTAPRSYLLVEQPISRLLLLATTSFPKLKRLGLLYGPTSQTARDELRRQIRTSELILVEKEVESEAELGGAIRSFIGNSDLLFIPPDPVVVNEGTAKTLILGAYMANLPLLGYSQALVKAGALMSVYSTPEMLGTQSAELIISGFWSDPSLAGVKIYPDKYDVSVNYQVARALAIDLPDERELLMRIRKAERVR